MTTLPFRWTDPGTWPWFVYLWLGFVLLGSMRPVWGRFRRWRTSSWPIADGRIESSEVKKASFLSSSRQGYFDARLSYVYSISGAQYTGRYSRGLPTEEEARQLIVGLEGMPITVHYNSSNPASSAVLDSDLNVLLERRASGLGAEQRLSTRHLAGWSRPYLWVFAALSCIGLALSLWVHLGALTGRRVAPEPFFWGLHIGIFVVWIPAVFVAKSLVGNLNRWDLWKLILSNAPTWMRYAVYGFFGYALVNFALFIAQAPNNGSGDPPAIVWRGFSGHWMAFYSAAFAILYSALQSDRERPITE